MRAWRSSASCCWWSGARRLKLGQTFALYVVLYTFARFWFENLRIDPAHEIAGMRLNAWVAIVVCPARRSGGSCGSVVTNRRNGARGHAEEQAAPELGADDVS